MVWLRRVLAALAGALLLGTAVLAVEVGLARRGPTSGPPPLELGGPVGEERGPALHVAWLGDSTAAGVGATGVGSALPVVVAEGLDRPVQLAVLARSGATLADVVADQLPVLAGAEVEPEVVFVSVGANDVTSFTARAEVERGYRRLLAGLPGGVRVVVLGVPDMGAIPRLAQPLRALAGWRGEQLDAVVRQVAVEAGSTYVDIAGGTGPAFRSDPRRFFAADRYHPSDDGYRRWAAVVLDALPGTMLAP